MSIITTQDFIAYKSVGKYIVKLKIPVGSRTNINRQFVVDHNHAKFRCDKAHVLEIRHKYTNRRVPSVKSNHDPSIQYTVGKDIVPRYEYDSDPDKVCASGIHFFLTREPAYDYGNDLKNGICRQWGDNGLLEVIGTKKNSHMDGEWKLCYEDGAIHVLDNWIDGERSGLLKIWDEYGFLKIISIYEEDKEIKSIEYGAGGHTMRFDIYDDYDRLAMSLEFWHEKEISIEDKMNHEYQLLNNDILVLSPDYIQH